MIRKIMRKNKLYVFKCGEEGHYANQCYSNDDDSDDDSDSDY